jgi:CheY-like chemotaxis protein
MSAAPTLLVADDDPLLRRLLDTLLTRAGYRTILAADGAELITLALPAPPDLILTDLSMPVLDGLAAMRQLRADPRTRTVPILAQSACPLLGAQAVTAGASAFMLKPFPLDDLLALVASHLSFRRDA